MKLRVLSVHKACFVLLWPGLPFVLGIGIYTTLESWRDGDRSSGLSCKSSLTSSHAALPTAFHAKWDLAAAVSRRYATAREKAVFHGKNP